MILDDHSFILGCYLVYWFLFDDFFAGYEMMLRKRMLLEAYVLW